MRAAHRESAALQAIDTTEVSEATARGLVLFFVLLLLAVPGVGFYLDARAGRLPAVAAAGKLLAHGVPSAADLAAFEQAVEDADWLRDVLLAPAQAGLLALGAGNERCLPGRDGTLFYRDAVAHLTGPSFLSPREQERRARASGKQPDSLTAIRAFAADLRARGIELLVVPIPVKAALYPERLSARYAPGSAPLAHPDTARWQAALAADGVHVLDLRPSLAALRTNAPVFLKTDTHWAPAGMQAAAGEIADYLQAHGLPHGSLNMAVHETPHTHTGDLAVMLRLGTYGDLFAPETVTLRQVTMPPRDQVAPVLLLGDSFSNIYSMAGLGWGEYAGLAPTLAARLGHGVDLTAVNDNGAHASREALTAAMARGDQPLAGKRWVVWAFSERELSFGDWRATPLPEEATAPAPVPDRTQVTGEVVALAQAPRPGSVPYADGVIAAVVRPADGPPLLAYLWGLKDHRRAPAADLAVGDTVSLRLESWRTAAATYGGFQRTELTDPAYLRLPAYWAGDPQNTASAATSPEAPAEADAAPVRPQAEDTAPPIAMPDCAAVAGKDGWAFFRPELDHLAAGRFWGKAAAAASKAADPALADPLPAITAFDADLKKAGVTLLVMPVPAKASVYAEAAPEGSKDAGQDTAFLAELQRRGVAVVDLLPLFLAHKDDGPPLYLKTDTHYAPRGIALAAEALAARILALPGFEKGDAAYATRTLSLDLTGDLACALNGAGETVALTRVTEGTGRRARPPKPDPDSPVLLMGDSHTLVFHAGGDLFATGSGLPDLTAAALGMPVDVLGVRGSGATTVRLDLARRDQPLAGKRVIVWVFTVRDFTQSSQGWAVTPL